VRIKTYVEPEPSVRLQVVHNKELIFRADAAGFNGKIFVREEG
jgi:hypothetical protein